MAKATKEVKQVQVTKIEEQEIIALELSKEEAEFLLFILENVAGDPYNSPRKIADDIADALREASITYQGKLARGIEQEIFICFKEYNNAN